MLDHNGLRLLSQTHPAVANRKLIFLLQKYKLLKKCRIMLRFIASTCNIFVCCFFRFYSLKISRFAVCTQLKRVVYLFSQMNLLISGRIYSKTKRFFDAPWLLQQVFCLYFEAFIALVSKSKK